jgi:hypothetical protein
VACWDRTRHSQWRAIRQPCQELATTPGTQHSSTGTPAPVLVKEQESCSIPSGCYIQDRRSAGGGSLGLGCLRVGWWRCGGDLALRIAHTEIALDPQCHVQRPGQLCGNCVERRPTTHNMKVLQPTQPHM